MDVEFAEDQFNKLWNDSVDISADFIDTISKRTWLNDEITPYELYLKLIYEYLEEDINMIAENEAIKKAELGNEYSYEFKRTINEILSKEGFEQGIVGFLGGVIQTGGTNLVNSLKIIDSKDSGAFTLGQGNTDTIISNLIAPAIKSKDGSLITYADDRFMRISESKKKK